MSAIRLYHDHTDTVTCVSNLFIDSFMPEANGEFVKVYLYLLRSVSGNAAECSISAIADKLDHTEKDVCRALKYWERMKLLKLELNADGALCGIHFLDPKPTGFDTPPSPPDKNSRAPIALSGADAKPERREYSPDEIREFQLDEAVGELFFIIETYLKHPLTSTDVNTVLYWYDSLHFPPDLIVHLVEQCISKGHPSMHYMDKVAMSWADAGIGTVEQAKKNAESHSRIYYSVMKAFGISGRNLVDSETALIGKWTKEYGFEIPIILEACRRTMTAVHQPSFEYADSILTSWHNSKVHTPEDIQLLDKTYHSSKKSARPAASRESAKRNKFNNFNQREYDYDNFEKMLLTTKV